MCIFKAPKPPALPPLAPPEPEKKPLALGATPTTELGQAVRRKGRRALRTDVGATGAGVGAAGGVGGTAT